MPKLLFACFCFHLTILSSLAANPDNWPSFRGPGATGIAHHQTLPTHWNETSNVVWKTSIPGLAHSSPVTWSSRIYLTSALSSRPDADFKPGLYGDGTASSDKSNHQWILYCLDSDTGKIIWNTTATQGKPKEKRHVKATYANATPATDGQHIVAFFGSQGLFAFNTNGTLLWQKDLGRLDVGAYDFPSYEWGSASSPIIHNNRVFLQCDSQKNSFIIALDIKSGETLWRTDRDELPSWGSPTVITTQSGVELVTNGSNFIRGYDPESGRELWRLGGSSKITAPTPFLADNLIIVASGRSPERPIFAIRPGARGDITLEEDHTQNQHIAWSKVRRGPYMPTPIAYQGILYVLGNGGLFDTYEVKTGNEIYRERIPHRGHGFSASPVAADGKLFLPSENGDVYVVQAGRQFSLLATNRLGEPLMATPAIARQKLILRTQHSLFAISVPSDQ